jgi:hypothetical protein
MQSCLPKPRDWIESELLLHIVPEKKSKFPFESADHFALSKYTKEEAKFFYSCTQLFTHPMALAVKEFLIPLAVCFDVYDNPLI